MSERTTLRVVQTRDVDVERVGEWINHNGVDGDRVELVREDEDDVVLVENLGNEIVDEDEIDSIVDDALKQADTEET